MKEFDRRVVPQSGMENLQVTETVSHALREIIEFEKARSVLFSQWGFCKSFYL